MTDTNVFWLPDPCPPWCIGVHSATDDLDIRRHDSDQLCNVLLTAMVNHRSDKALFASVYLVQGYREISPLVHFEASHDLKFVFTLDEAERIGTTLLEAVRQGTGTDHAPAH